MEHGKPRIARLTAIITQLQSQSIVTAREIANKHDVSIRTVYRDIRTLEQSGIPVYTEEGKGYSLLEGYKLPPVMFTEDEANALITAEQIINKNKDQSLADQYTSAVEKIKSVLHYSDKNKTELLTKRLQIRGNRANEKSSNHLILLQKTVTNFQVVSIEYQSLNNKNTTREIEPFALVHTQDNWVLLAYCRLRKDFRAFRLDCIVKLHVLPISFKPHTITLEDFYKNAAKYW